MTLQEKYHAMCNELETKKYFDFFAYLAGRWASEKQFEDINEYLKAFADRTGYETLKISKRPFCIEFLWEGNRAELRVERRKVIAKLYK